MGTCEVTRWLARPATDRVARAAFLGSMTPYLAGAVGEAFVDAMVVDLLAARPRWFHEGAHAYFATDGTGSGVSRALVDDGIRAILATPLEVQIACLRTFATTDLTDDLAEIRLPVLVLHGDADASAPIDLTGRPTANLLRNGRFRLVEGAPHGLYVTVGVECRVGADLFLDLEREAAPGGVGLRPDRRRPTPACFSARHSVLPSRTPEPR